MSKTKITAHRGYSKIHVENSIPAFEHALKLGCDRIEFDIHFSKDKKLVVHHDYIVKTSSNEHRPIIETNYSEMIETIPLLDSILDITYKRVELEIELKSCGTEFIESILSKIQKHNILDQIEFTSPHPYVLSYLRKKLTYARLGMFVSNFPQWLPKVVGYQLILDSMRIGEIDIAHCPINIINQEFIYKLQNLGKFIHAANCNSRVELEKAFNLGVSQLSTDELELALATRNNLVNHP